MLDNDGAAPRKQSPQMAHLESVKQPIQVHHIGLACGDCAARNRLMHTDRNAPARESRGKGTTDESIVDAAAMKSRVSVKSLHDGDGGSSVS
jgi:hypothetical protein